MSVLVFFILAFFAIILFSFISAIRLLNKNSVLQAKLQKLESRLLKVENELFKSAAAGLKQYAGEEKQETVPVEAKAIPVPGIFPIEPSMPKARTGKPEYWGRIEKQFMDNWTGILGSVIMVMGAAFLSVYAALKLAPFYRFLMLCAFSGALFSIYWALRAKAKWLKLAVWLRSSGCAVFLFACLGSGGIPGLKWIESPFYGLGLLLLGAALNLVVGSISGSQFFASFHSVISLAALAVAPQSRLTLGIAVGICLLQVFMTYRDRWEYHLLVTITSFLVYHFYWVYSLDLLSSPMPLDLRLTGIAATALIGITTACVHYRKIYGARDFDRLPFIVHLFNWVCMGAGFYVYSTGSKWNTVVLMTAALAAFFLSRRAKKLAIRWLFITDTLIAQALALLAVLTLKRWQLTGVPISAILMVEVMAFLAVMLLEEEAVLQRAGVFLYHSAGIVLMINSFIIAQARQLSTLPPDAGILAAAMAVYTGFHLYLVRRKSESFDSFKAYGLGTISGDFSLAGVIAGLLGYALFNLVYDFLWAPYAAAALITVLLLLRRRLQLKGLEIGTALMVIGVFLLGWAHLRSHVANLPLEAAIYGLPFLVIAAVGSHTSFSERLGRYRKFWWIYLFSFHLALYSYAVLNPLSPLAPGMAWLLLAPIYLESALFLYRRSGGALREKGEPHRFLLQWGYMFIALFLVRHLLVHIQSNLYIGAFKARLLMELLALAVFSYWAMVKKPGDDDGSKTWQSLHPLMWELAVVFAVMTVGLEVSDTWLPVAWVIGAFLLLILGIMMKERISRFRFYSLLLYWAAAFHTAFISSMDQTPARLVLQQAWFGGLLALLLQLGFVVFFYRAAALEQVELPGPVSFFRGWLDKINRRRHLWIYYPYFLAAALFLYWTFDRSLLTLLWVAETFVIFALSIVFRENHFRYVALAGLAGCLVRLIFVDLVRSGTFTRAMVFLGVGVIMILMNSLYNKYRERFRDE